MDRSRRHREPRTALGSAHAETAGASDSGRPDEHGRARARAARHPRPRQTSMNREELVALVREARPHIERTTPDTEAWLSRLEERHDALHELVEGLLEADPQAALELAAALWPFWWLRGHMDEGREFLERAVAIDGPDRQQAVKGLGTIAFRQGDLDAAEGCLRSARRARPALWVTARRHRRTHRSLPDRPAPRGLRGRPRVRGASSYRSSGAGRGRGVAAAAAHMRRGRADGRATTRRGGSTSRAGS